MKVVFLFSDPLFVHFWRKTPFLMMTYVEYAITPVLDFHPELYET